MEHVGHGQDGVEDDGMPLPRTHFRSRSAWPQRACHRSALSVGTVAMGTGTYGWVAVMGFAAPHCAHANELRAPSTLLGAQQVAHKSVSRAMWRRWRHVAESADSRESVTWVGSGGVRLDARHRR